MQVLVTLLHITLVVAMWYILAHQAKHDVGVVPRASQDTYMGLLSNVKDGARSLLPINLSTLSLVRVLNSSLNGSLSSFSTIEEQVHILKNCKYASSYMAITLYVSTVFLFFFEFSGGSRSIFSIFHCTTPFSEFLHWGGWSPFFLLRGKKSDVCTICQLLIYFRQCNILPYV